MGTKFVGSNDVALASSQSLVNGVEWIGAWVELEEAEIYECSTIFAQGGGVTTVVTYETDRGIVGGTQQADTFLTHTQAGGGTKTTNVPMGGIPGGRRIRARATATGGAAIITTQAKETRSGL